MRICFLPGSDSINLENVVRSIADLDAVSRYRPAKYQRKEVILNGSLLEIRDIYSYITVS